MNREVTDSVEEMGLLANGTSARWDIAINECLDRDEWSMEIEAAHTYLTFQVDELNAIRAALDFLQTGPPPQGGNGQANAHDTTALAIGRFGPASVSLLWDNEDFLRCFLVVRQNEHSTLRMSFDEDDVRMLIEALGQVVEDLPTAERQPPSFVPQSSPAAPTSAE